MDDKYSNRVATIVSKAVKRKEETKTLTFTVGAFYNKVNARLVRLCRMTKIIVLGCVLLSFFSCKHILSDPAKPVGKAALRYYQQLLNGNYAAFVDATYRPDSLPSTYRSQLILNAKMFIEQQQNEHNGLKSVAVAHATIDEAQHTGNAFLTFRYGDGSSEQVVVPMVEHDGAWYLR